MSASSEAARFLFDLPSNPTLCAQFAAAIQQEAQNPGSTAVNQLLAANGYACTEQDVAAAASTALQSQILLWAGIYQTLLAATNAPGNPFTITNTTTVQYGASTISSFTFSNSALTWPAAGNSTVGGAGNLQFSLSPDGSRKFNGTIGNQTVFGSQPALTTPNAAPSGSDWFTIAATSVALLLGATQAGLSVASFAKALKEKRAATSTGEKPVNPKTIEQNRVNIELQDRKNDAGEPKNDAGEPKNDAEKGNDGIENDILVKDLDEVP